MTAESAISALCRARRRQSQHRIDRLSLARSPQFLSHVLVAQQPRDSRQSLQVIGARAFRREKQKDEVDRLAIHRLEIDRALKPGKQSEDLFELRKLAVRNRDAVSDRG